MKELETISHLTEHLAKHGSLKDCVLQGLDLTDQTNILKDISFKHSALLGCPMQPEDLLRAQNDGALIFPELPGVPYCSYRGCLYTVEDLYEAFDRSNPDSYAECFDARVYAHWKKTGKASPPSILESLARSIHDHAISDALESFLADDGTGAARKVVAIMGGHVMERAPEGPYAQMASLSKALTERGYLMASGGGPGAMEATHLGAWFAGQSDEALSKALLVLQEAPSYKDKLWLSKAFEVREKWPQLEGAPPSLGIPTWLYGHEPPNAFATHIAKYFANSVREDGLLAIARHGIIFSPGGNGTIQEVFQDACQNRYVTVGTYSPMVFWNKTFWTETTPVYPLLEQIARPYPYHRWLTITDDQEEVLSHIEAFAASDQAPGN